MIKNYTELSRLRTFEERYQYLKLGGAVGARTFGSDRFYNQQFYLSQQWKHIRDSVIIRDMGCDLGVPDFEIYGKIIIHHMNPITINDIEEQTELLLNPEFLICVSPSTHNAIHYGDASQLRVLPPTRTQNDTAPWRKQKG